MFDKVDQKVSFPDLEKQLMARWKEEDTFQKSLDLRAGKPRFVFYEGPPTANGKPATHHILARAFKDLFPRYKTMKGFYVERKAGWDTHGLPVEIEIEKKLGISGKFDIENEIGIERFNELCRASVYEYVSDWVAFSERMGFWLDYENAYWTLTPDYIQRSASSGSTSSAAPACTSTSPTGSRSASAWASGSTTKTPTGLSRPITSRDRHRAVQRALPRQRVRVRLRLGRVQRAHGLLARLRKRLLDSHARLHPVGLVGSERDVEARPCVQGFPRRAVLPALRNSSVESRARPGLPGQRARPERVRPVQARERSQHRDPRLDDHALDAAWKRRAGGRQRHRLHQGQGWRRFSDPGRVEARGAERSTGGRRTDERPRPGRARVRTAVSLLDTQRGARALCRRRGLRGHRRRHRRRAHLGPLRRRRPAALPVEGHPLPAHGRPRRQVPAVRREVRGPPRQRSRPGHHR